MIAHIAGVPLEEVATSLAGAGGGLLVARTWLRQRLRRRHGNGI
jgi:hypothetical protein